MKDIEINLLDKKNKIKVGLPIDESIFKEIGEKDILDINKVNDVHRYWINYEKGKLTKQFIDKKNTKFSKSKYADDIISENYEDKTIVLLLESPHKDEYDSCNNAIAPAQGKTGENIDKNIITLLRELESLNPGLFNEGRYRFIICNPIQYQTSLYMYHKHELEDDYRTLRNRCWKKIWRDENIQEDFKSRLDLYKPILIINACTSALQIKVTQYLKENNYNNIYTTYHPSYWNGFNIKEQ